MCSIGEIERSIHQAKARGNEAPIPRVRSVFGNRLRLLEKWLLLKSKKCWLCV